MRGPLLDEDEVATLATELGEPRRERIALAVDRVFFETWQSKSTTRRGEVMFLLPRPGGLLLHTKAHYPPNSWRLLTGGVEVGEAVREALVREPQEEVGLALAPERFLGVVEYEFRWGGRTEPWVTYIFLMEASSAPLQPSVDDEIAATCEVVPAQLGTVAEALDALPGEYFHDWGRFRAIAHRLVAAWLG
jgi:8-oxo-dGTP pyrophosphatase MutT (NUDIX family)